jgi:hypothetical protein
MKLAALPCLTPVLLAVSSLTAPTVQAQTAEAPEKVEPPAWTAQAKGSLLVTSGNSRSQNGVLGFTGQHNDGDNKQTLDAQIAYGRSAALVPALNALGQVERYDRRHETTTNQWSVKGRADRSFTKNNAAFVAASVGADKIAGKSLISGGQAGYSRQLYKSTVHTAVAELGYDFSYERYVQPPTRTVDPVQIHSARLLLGETMALSADTGINASFEALFNLNEETAPNASDGTNKVAAFDDTRFVGKLGLTTRLWKSLSFGFGFTIRYDQNPALLPTPPAAKGLMFAPTFNAFASKVDTLTEANLVFTFL